MFRTLAFTAANGKGLGVSAPNPRTYPINHPDLRAHINIKKGRVSLWRWRVVHFVYIATLSALRWISADGYSDSALAVFAARAIRPEVAAQSGIREVTSVDAGSLIGRSGGMSGRFDGIAIPNIFPGEKHYP
jgi:hypothetical protein